MLTSICFIYICKFQCSMWIRNRVKMWWKQYATFGLDKSPKLSNNQPLSEPMMDRKKILWALFSSLSKDFMGHVGTANQSTNSDQNENIYNQQKSCSMIVDIYVWDFAHQRMGCVSLMLVNYGLRAMKHKIWKIQSNSRCKCFLWTWNTSKTTNLYHIGLRNRACLHSEFT